jgi:hypothetical protein
MYVSVLLLFDIEFSGRRVPCSGPVIGGGGGGVGGGRGINEI